MLFRPNAAFVFNQEAPGRCLFLSGEAGFFRLPLSRFKAVKNVLPSGYSKQKWALDGYEIWCSRLLVFVK